MSWEDRIGLLIEKGVLGKDSIAYYRQAIANERMRNPDCPFAVTIEAVLAGIELLPDEVLLGLLSEMNWRIAASGGEVRSE